MYATSITVSNPTLLPCKKKNSRWRFSNKFQIGVCHQGSFTLSLFKDATNIGTIFKAKTPKMTPYSEKQKLRIK